jgi:glycosyltransferase involved in cell wall biosynthesis
MQIGVVTLHDLDAHDAIGGGLAYRRRLLAVLRARHDVEVRRVSVPEARSTAGKTLEKIRLAAKLQAVRGTKDVWIRDFRELAFIGADRVRGRRIALVHHIDSRFVPHRAYNRLCDAVGIRRLRSIDTVVTVSRYWQARLRARGARDVRVIHNCLDPAQFARPSAERVAEFRRRHGLGARPIVYIGNCRADKGADLAYDILKDEDCALVTSGPSRLSLDCPNLELPYADYLTLLWASSAAALLSRFDEGWCLSAHEAMMCETPVVGSGRGGMRELLEEGGQIVADQPGDVRSAVRALLADRDRGREQGLRGQACAGRYTVERFAEGWLDLLAESWTKD